MIVMKFGGTSLQDADAIGRAVEIVRAHERRRPLVVVSAMGSTTRQLLALGHAALDEGLVAGRDRLAEIAAAHRKALGALGLDATSRGEVDATITGYLEGLGRYVEGVVMLQEYSRRTQDAVISYGERFSTALFAAAARAAGLNAVRVDAGEVVITDDRFRRARPVSAEIRGRADRHIAPLIEQERVPVIEGFVGATLDGVATTMGFEASDYTAALLGAALGAEEIQIWTDVPGMLTTAHAAVSPIFVVRELSFVEAAELAAFGAKVLHPDTVEPARQENIVVRILPSHDPGADGTRITAGAASPNATVKSIAVREGIDAITLQSHEGSPVHRTLWQIGEAFDRHELSPLLLASSGDAVVALAEPDASLDACLRELSPHVQINRDSDFAVVCAVGEGIASDPELIGRGAAALGGLDVRFVATGVSGASLPFLLPAAQVADAVARLHAAFFDDAPDSGLFAPAG